MVRILDLDSGPGIASNGHARNSHGRVLADVGPDASIVRQRAAGQIQGRIEPRPGPMTAVVVDVGKDVRE